MYGAASKKKHLLQESNDNTKYVLIIYAWTMTYICQDSSDKTVEILTTNNINHCWAVNSII